jgi:hypothetical protein
MVAVQQASSNRNYNFQNITNLYGYASANPLKFIDPLGLLDEGGGGGGGDNQSCPLISSVFLGGWRGLQVYLCIYDCNEGCPGSFENIKMKIEWSPIGFKGCSDRWFKGIDDKIYPPPKE